MQMQNFEKHVWAEIDLDALRANFRTVKQRAGSLPLCAVVKADSYGHGPDLIYLPEVDFDMDQFLADVERIYKEKGNCMVAVSEGIHYADGSFVSEAKTSATDGFGHAQLGGLAAMLADVVKQKMGVKVRGIELSLLQRCGSHLASRTDIQEAYAAGKAAVEAAVKPGGQSKSTTSTSPSSATASVLRDFLEAPRRMAARSSR